ncbi:MAG: helix-turn-helix domain-containing protein [Planctomycetota bacterium]
MQRIDSPMMSVRGVAQRLGVSSSMVYSLIARGTLSVHRIGRCIRVSDEQVEDYLRQCRQSASAPSEQERPYRHISL